METAIAGRWVYIAKSDSGFGQSGRGTQVGTLGGSWSTQVDLGGSGGLTGCCGESTAASFLDRDGNIIYIRAASYGDGLYYCKSVDGGYTWSSPVQAYSDAITQYTTAAPVGVFESSYSFGEYLWFAGFGGSENTLRLIPLWITSQPYALTGTVRLLGSAGGDLDPGSAYEYNLGNLIRSLGAGSYTTAATDLALPGRLLDFAFTRTYNSADGFESGALGYGWTNSLDWRLVENGALVTVRRGDAKQDRFTRNADGTYAVAPGVFDKLTKNADSSFTLTTPHQVQYQFGGTSAAAYAGVVQSDSPAGYWRFEELSGTNVADQENVQAGTAAGAVTRGDGGV